MSGEAFEGFGLRRRAFRVLGFQCRVLGVEVLGSGDWPAGFGVGCNFAAA